MQLALQVGLAWLGLGGLVVFFIYCCSVVSHRWPPHPAEDEIESSLGSVEGRRQPIGAIPTAPPRARERRVVPGTIRVLESRLPR